MIGIFLCFLGIIFFVKFTDPFLIHHNPGADFVINQSFLQHLTADELPVVALIGTHECHLLPEFFRGGLVALDDPADRIVHLGVGHRNPHFFGPLGNDEFVDEAGEHLLPGFEQGPLHLVRRSLLGDPAEQRRPFPVEVGKGNDVIVDNGDYPVHHLRTDNRRLGKSKKGQGHAYNL